MYLGIEIGGTKLQWIVGNGLNTDWIEVQRLAVSAERGAEGIREQLRAMTLQLVAKYPQIQKIGIGFGGPVDTVRGRVILSNQIDGWRDFPLVEWMESQFERPTILANDSDCAGLAEAVYGAGKGFASVFYSNVGSGIGGALVIDGRLYTGGSGVASEIGHLRPSLQEPEDVEARASGWAITEQVRRACLAAPNAPEAQSIREHGEAYWQALNTKTIVQLAMEEQNQFAIEAFNRCTTYYGWAIAQMITLLAPNVVVLGGGVSLAPESLFLQPVTRAVEQYVFPAMRGSYAIRPALLGEEVVVAGAIAAVAAKRSQTVL